MNNVLALVDLYDQNDLGLLTKDRPLASTTFLGRYAFIDFVLSNLTNSGIDNIGILVKEHVNNIHKHILFPNTYLTNPKTGYLSFLINEKGIINPVYNTDINNIKENDFVLFDENTKYIIITNSSIISKTDYRKIVDEHIESGKLCSLVYKKVEHSNEFANSFKVVSDNLNCVQKLYKDMKDEPANVLLNTLIIDKELFINMLKKSNELSVVYSLEDMVNYIANYVTKINLIEFKGTALCFNSLEKYYKHSLDFLNNPELLKDFFKDENWSFYTTTHNSRPVLHGEHALVENSLIANGSTIEGTVKNSIISRDVVIEEGATVENSIIFTHCVIKAGTHIKNVIADKRVHFVEKKEVIGDENKPLYFPRGANV